MNNYPWLEQYMLSKPGAASDFKAEWGWQRYMVGGKMFAATMCPSAKYDPMYAEKQLLSLKCDPELAEILRREHSEIMPGFYTDKRNWNSVYLGGNLPPELIKQMIDDSYALVFSKLTRKLQGEIALAANGEKS